VYHARGLEPTLSELQAQIDRLSLTVHQGREHQGQLAPMAQQLTQLTDRLADILNRWSEADQKQAFALREVHDEPIKQLREQAAALSEICVSAANLAVQGFERAEARIVSLESNLQDRLSQLSEDVRAALADGRHGPSRPALAGGVAPFPLDGVMRIHDEIRGTGALRMARAEPAFEPETDYRPQLEAATLAVRVETLEREVISEREQVRETATRAEHIRRNWRMSFVLLGGGILGVGLLGWWQVNARLEDAQTRVAIAQRDAQAASNAASRQLESTRADAARQIAEAKQSARNAEIVSNVLAAPDLIRYALVGATDGPDRPYAQVLWSRAHGIVISAARLPAPPEGSVFQVWLTNNTGPVSAGTFRPDSEGRATLAAAPPANVPRPVTGVMITLESSAGQVVPSGQTMLTRAQ